MRFHILLLQFGYTHVVLMPLNAVLLALAHKLVPAPSAPSKAPCPVPSGTHGLLLPRSHRAALQSWDPSGQVLPVLPISCVFQLVAVQLLSSCSPHTGPGCRHWNTSRHQWNRQLKITRYQ